jgi:hypothetical protein
MDDYEAPTPPKIRMPAKEMRMPAKEMRVPAKADATAPLDVTGTEFLFKAR